MGGYVLAVAFSPDGRMMAGAGSHSFATGGYGGEGRVTLWDSSTGKILKTLNGPTGRAEAVAFSPDGRTVAAAGTGPTREGRATFSGRRVLEQISEVVMFDVITGNKVCTSEGETDGAFSLAFSSDGKVFGFCDSSYVYLMNSADGKLRDIIMQTIRSRHVKNVMQDGHEPSGDKPSNNAGHP